jgi:exodeoxyribonuclease X
MTTAILFDTEVNSLDAKECIELAMAAVHVSDTGVTIEHLSVERFEPKAPCDAGAVAVHHIDPESLKGCRPSLEANVGQPEYVIGHNVDFDCEVIGDMAAKRICTLALSRYLWPQFKSHKLSALYLELNGINNDTIAVIKHAHAADADVKILASIFQRIWQESKVSSMKSLHSLSETAKIPTVWPFGKHIGVRFEDTPRDYIKWAMNNLKDIDPYLMKALKAVK